jgi:hypothetical protein
LNTHSRYSEFTAPEWRVKFAHGNGMAMAKTVAPAQRRFHRADVIEDDFCVIFNGCNDSSAGHC